MRLKEMMKIEEQDWRRNVKKNHEEKSLNKKKKTIEEQQDKVFLPAGVQCLVSVLLRCN